MIKEDKQLDQHCKVHKQPANNLKKLQKLINETVHYEITEKADGTKTMLTHTSLTGHAKCKLLKELPNKLSSILHKETVDTVVKI